MVQRVPESFRVPHSVSEGPRGSWRVSGCLRGSQKVIEVPWGSQKVSKSLVSCQQWKRQRARFRKVSASWRIWLYSSWAGSSFSHFLIMILIFYAISCIFPPRPGAYCCQKELGPTLVGSLYLMLRAVLSVSWFWAGCTAASAYGWHTGTRS